MFLDCGSQVRVWGGGYTVGAGVERGQLKTCKETLWPSLMPGSDIFKSNAVNLSCGFFSIQVDL